MRQSGPDATLIVRGDLNDAAGNIDNRTQTIHQALYFGRMDSPRSGNT